MQSQSSSSTAPALKPQVPVQKPAIVERHSAKHRGRGPWWVVGLLLIAVIAVGVLYWQKQSTASDQAAAASRAVRTAKVYTGGLNASIRLTGATSAENFVSLLVPQLRGSRSGYGRDRQSVQTASAVPALSLSSGSGSSSPGSSASAGSTTSSAANMSSALKSSTSRFGSAPRSPAAGASSASSGTPAASSALGADGTGSTASALPPSGGGGGGGNDFMLVLQKMVKPGSHVKKGEVVAEFDRQYMMNRLDDYRASVIQAEAGLHKLKADLAITRQAHKQSIEKAKGLLGKTDLDLKTVPVLSAIDAERAKLAKQDAEARYKELLSEVKLVETSLNSQIRNAEIDLQQTKIELKRAEANADRMIVKSPIAGLTVMQSIPRGGEIAQVQQGDQLYPGITFISIVDPSSMVVNALVNQSDVERLRIGAKAKVRFDAYPDLELPARVYSVGGIAKQGGQRASYVKEIPVRLKLERTDPRVIPDLSVSADVVIESEPQQAAVVPLAAVFRDAPSRTPYVYVQRPEGWVRRDVQLGVVSFTAAAVRSGIDANDVVAVERPPDSNQKTSAQ